ncbi:MAG: class I SAM-dependent methyltransferase [Nanoarchaeota archaeon]|nr:class I SAM-dependent methyltransferase [Nanoarchaeota archaeon]
MNPKIQSVLKELEKTNKEFWNTPPEDCQLLNFLIKISKTKRVLELGMSNGYSTIWMAATGAEVVSMEKWVERIEEAKKNFEKAGVEIQIIEGDILENISKLEGKFDFVFIDAMKSQYLDYLKLLLEGKLAEGAIVAAHNVINKKEDLKEYVDYVKKNFESVTIPGDKGMEVTLVEKF